MTIPAATSLYAILGKSIGQIPEQKGGIDIPITAVRNHTKVEGIYNIYEQILGHQCLGEEELLKKIYTQTDNKAWILKILGPDADNAEDAHAKLEKAKGTVETFLEQYDEKVVELNYKSFPETYFHNSIALALASTGNLTNLSAVTTRIEETGQIISKLFERPLAITFAMSASHLHKRGKANYTQDTVEFTLLTFSYLIYPGPDLSYETDWFYFWRVIGSMMGLEETRLPCTLQEAQARWGYFGPTTYPATKVNSEAEKLLSTFIKKYIPSKKKFTELTDAKMLSKRMVQYYEETNK